jgi:hypothetical protein
MKKKPRPNCLLCGKETKRTTTKFCSRQCMHQWKKENNMHYGGGPKRSKPLKYCRWCDRPFYPIHSYNKFCTKQCSGKYRVHIRKDVKFIEDGVKYRFNNLSKETMEQIRLASIKIRRTKRTDYTRGNGGIREDLGHYVRSNWEANIARVLKIINVEYQYESKSFKLRDSDGKLYIYTPDFCIEEKIFIEVKGWETDTAKKKKQMMSEQYPDIHIIYINEFEYKKIAEKFKDIVKTWEHSKKHKY